MSPPTVVLVGTLDTKGEEYAFLRDRLELAGVASLLVDVGTQGRPRTPADVGREEVAAAGGFDVAALTDRGRAVEAMCAAAPVVLRRLFEEGRCQGVLAAGGSGNTAIATAAMRALPVGVPKLVVSTMAAGDSLKVAGCMPPSDRNSVTVVCIGIGAAWPPNLSPSRPAAGTTALDGATALNAPRLTS